MKLSATVARALREGALWFLGAVALLLVLALLSYHEDDASFCEYRRRRVGAQLDRSRRCLAGRLLFLPVRPAGVLYSR